MKIYELKAMRQKSYYGKATVYESDTIVALKSYDTFVCYIDKTTGTFYRTWDGYSATTAKHVDDFRRLNNLKPLDKKEWLNIEYTACNVLGLLWGEKHEKK